MKIHRYIPVAIRTAFGTSIVIGLLFLLMAQTDIRATIVRQLNPPQPWTPNPAPVFCRADGLGCAFTVTHVVCAAEGCWLDLPIRQSCGKTRCGLEFRAVLCNSDGCTLPASALLGDDPGPGQRAAMPAFPPSCERGCSVKFANDS